MSIGINDEKIQKNIQFFVKKTYKNVITISTKNKSSSYKVIIDILNKTKFNALLPKFAIIGIPNVGKSTLLNIMKNKALAITEDRAGVTKKSS